MDDDAIVACLNYSVSQPPLSTVLSNRLVIRVGTPWLSHIFLTSSQRA